MLAQYREAERIRKEVSFPNVLINHSFIHSFAQAEAAERARLLALRLQQENKAATAIQSVFRGWRGEHSLRSI